MTDAAWAAVLASAELTSGWYTFLPDGDPIEWTADLAERLRYIAAEKPAQERAVRRRVHAEARRVHAEARRAVRSELLALALALVPDAPWIDGALRFAGDRTGHG